MTQTRKDLTFGIVVLVIGLIYLGLTMQLPRKGGIDSSTVPYLLAILMTALGVIQIVGAVRKGRVEAERAKSLKSELMEAAGDDAKDCNCAPAPTASRPDYKTVAITALLIFLYVAFLDHLGFLVMSALYLFAQITVLTPVYVKKNYLLYAVISIIASAGVYYIFLWSFDIMLPHGNFWYDLGVDFEWYPF